MYYILVFLLCFAYIISCAHASFAINVTSENATYKTQSKIIGGQPVEIRHQPFMLSLHNSYGFLCGASILSKTWGITALHCLDSLWSWQYYVRAGSNRIDRGGTLHRMTNIRVFNNTYFSKQLRILYHDIAVFEVKPPFRFSRTIRPIRLPESSNRLEHELFVCGWGYTNIEKIESTAVLMGVHVQHVPFEVCVNATSEYATLVRDDYHLCYGTQGKDSCYGDSGGPLANKRTIYGIVSFGHHCGQVAGVYVKVSYYRKWIKDVTKL